MNCLKHVISFLKSFQWLLISVRAKARIPRMANKILCSQPPVIFYFLHCTHSSLFAVPGKFQACSFIGAFELPHPSAWNFLLPDAAWPTFTSFQALLKGHLFNEALSDDPVENHHLPLPTPRMPPSLTECPMAH